MHVRRAKCVRRRDKDFWDLLWTGWRDVQVSEETKTPTKPLLSFAPSSLSISLDVHGPRMTNRLADSYPVTEEDQLYSSKI